MTLFQKAVIGVLLSGLQAVLGLGFLFCGMSFHLLFLISIGIMFVLTAAASGLYWGITVLSATIPE